MTKGIPRSPETYRSARRNAAKGTVWKGIEPKNPSSLESGDAIWDGKQYVKAVRINRSKKWDGVPLTRPYR